MNTIIAYILTLVMYLALSWGTFTGLFALICLCFSWKFSLATATGVWLVSLLAIWVFRGYGNKSNNG